MSGVIPDMTIRYRWAAGIVCSAVEDGNGGMTMSGGWPSCEAAAFQLETTRRDIFGTGWRWKHHV